MQCNGLHPQYFKLYNKTKTRKLRAANWNSTNSRTSHGWNQYAHCYSIMQLPLKIVKNHKSLPVQLLPTSCILVTYAVLSERMQFYQLCNPMLPIVWPNRNSETWNNIQKQPGWPSLLKTPTNSHKAEIRCL